MITAIPPTDWRDLQRQVARILQESGFEAEVEKKIDTVRGRTTVDVFARDIGRLPPIIYLCECKHWKTPVCRSEVNAFLAVMGGCGANLGLIISSGGFQSGAYQAAEKTNIRLLSWGEFQELFEDLWLEKFLKPRLKAEVDPLLEYMVPISYPFGFMPTPEALQEVKRLRERYAALASLGESLIYAEAFNEGSRFNLPRRSDTSSRQVPRIDGGRQFLEAYTQDARTAVAEFCRIFGEPTGGRGASPNSEAAPDANRALRGRRR